MLKASPCRSMCVAAALVALMPFQADAQRPSTGGGGNSSKPESCYYGTPQSGARTISGVSACGTCHSRQQDSPQILAAANNSRIRQDETLIWFEDDKHRSAFEVLQNERSQAMARILGIVDPQTKESLIHRDVRCLACHSSGPLDKSEREGLLLPAATIDDKLFNLGVSCEGCHGPAGAGEDVPGWVAAHFLESTASNWRQLSPEDRFEKYGYWDVSNPRTKARICLSCHVGSVEEGKVLTHEMYAAGHPPLPSFELNTFVHQQPRHWKQLEEKPADARTEIAAQRQIAYDPNGLNETRALLVAALESAASAVSLTADLIDDGVTSSTVKPAWPELANYSCFACHHDLQRDGWRQARPLTPTPGRPTLHEWPLAMAEVAAESAGHGEAFRKHVAGLYLALDRQPFGRPEELKNVCRQLSASSREWASEILQQPSPTVPQGDQLLQLIARKGAERTYDYDSARQLVWAYERVLQDIQEQSSASGDAESNAGDRLRWKGWLVDKELSPRETLLKSLESQLALDLREGIQVEQTFGQELIPRLRVESDLEKSLELASRYNARALQAAFQQLLEIDPR